jgi:hypothetical protein
MLASKYCPPYAKKRWRHQWYERLALDRNRDRPTELPLEILAARAPTAEF